jgi:putative DNA primase/helicase
VPDALDRHFELVDSGKVPLPEELSRAASGEPGSPPFLPLGHDRGRFFFWVARGRQVRDFGAADLNKIAYLSELAELSYWVAQYPRDEGNGTSTTEAGADLIAQCYGRGIYDPSAIRGRGAWLDGDRAVLHLGDRLLVDGRLHGLSLPESRFVYEAGRAVQSVHLPKADPLPDEVTGKLVDICKGFAWERPVNGVLLAGWLTVAPVCGALAWRPSIWLTGGTGSGKSTLQEHVMAPVLGGMVLRVQGNTTEAGIRQALCSDALPVVFDEAEREDKQAKTRMRGVLSLMRQASTEGGAEVIKGSPGHRAARFRLRTCMALSSINVSLEHGADMSRVTVLSLRSGGIGEEKFRKLMELVHETLTPEFSAGLLARTVQLLPTLRRNAETFAVAAKVLGTRRAGDQLGALLAGAYSLKHTGEITAEQAERYVSEAEWVERPAAEDSDERRLLAEIMGRKIRVSMPEKPAMEVPIGRLVEAARGWVPDILNDIAAQALKETGIKLQTEPLSILISTNHLGLKAILAGTPWSAGWHYALKRLPGAYMHPINVRFGLGIAGKAVVVPMALLDEGKDD